MLLRSSYLTQLVNFWQSYPARLLPRARILERAREHHCQAVLAALGVELAVDEDPAQHEIRRLFEKPPTRCEHAAKENQ